MVDVEHWFIALRQKRPVVGVHEAVSPHSHTAAFGAVPSLFGQERTAEHLLRDEEQKRPVVGVQAAAPQMHTSLLAVVPSVFEQSGDMAQRQGTEEEHLVVVVV